MKKHPSRLPLIALALMAMLAATSCGGSDQEPSTGQGEDPVKTIGWDEVLKIADAKEGEYHKEVVAIQAGSEVTMLQEWVTFDLRKKAIDRRIGAGAASGMKEGTRSDPSLRFLYDGSRMLMWNPIAQESCGTPWVEMSPEEIEQATGISFSADLYAIEPLEILKEAEAPDEPVDNDDARTVYEAETSGLAGVPLSSFFVDNPEVIGELEKQEQTVRVEAFHDEPTIRVEVDLTEVMKAVMPEVAGDEGAKMIWTVQAPTDVPELELPSKVGDPSCF